MKNLFNNQDRQEILARVNNLTSAARPEWGVMSVNQMLCHVSDPFRDLLGLRQTKPVVPGILRPLLRKFLLGKKPFGKNAPTLKPYQQKDKGNGTRPVGFDSDKKALLELLENFCGTPENFSFRPHPGAGKMTREQNGLLMWKHLDHHLRQFGV